MRIRVQPWFVGLCGALLLASVGCGKNSVVRAPTSVVAEEAERAPLLVARATGEEEEQPARPKDTKAEPEPSTFAFPADRGGELLSKQLTPSATRPLTEPAAQPRRVRIAAYLEAPELPLPPSLAIHSVPPERARKPLMPRLVTPEALVSLALELALPQAQPLAVGERTKEPGADVNKPAPLPILGQQLPDRASLADATSEASGTAVISATMPVRQQTVPFQRLAVPDPYENYRPLRLPVPAEATDPVTGSPRTPTQP